MGFHCRLFNTDFIISIIPTAEFVSLSEAKYLSQWGSESFRYRNGSFRITTDKRCTLDQTLAYAQFRVQNGASRRATYSVMGK